MFAEVTVRNYAIIPVIVFVVVVALIATSCRTTAVSDIPALRDASVGPISSGNPPIRAESCFYMPVGPYKVWMPACACPPSGVLCKTVAEAAKAHINAFQLQEGFQCRAGNIVVTSFMPSTQPGRPLLGYYSSPDLIVVWVGGGWDLGALYHELCHMHLAQGDVEHVHPKWPVWDRRGDDVAAAIVSASMTAKK